MAAGLLKHRDPRRYGTSGVAEVHILAMVGEVIRFPCGDWQ